MFSTHCQNHKLTIFCIFEAKSLWQQLGHQLDNLHMFWRSAVKYLRTILLSCCAVRQNPLDWEQASSKLKTERYDKERKNRCLPQCDAGHTRRQLSHRRWIEAFLSMMWKTPQSRWRGWLWRHYWVLYKDLPTRETITATQKQTDSAGLQKIKHSKEHYHKEDRPECCTG